MAMEMGEYVYNAEEYANKTQCNACETLELWNFEEMRK